MKMNNKGYMLVEIILAFVITFLLVYLMMNLIIKFKTKNDDLVVESLVKTDQSIITNKLMEYVLDEGDTFDCKSLLIDSSSNVVMYKDVLINKVSDYADLSSFSCDVDDGVKINIPIDVKQLADENFDVNINYHYGEKLNGCDKVLVDLDEGMIPIVIANDGEVTTIDENDDNYYNYCEHKWANIVLVKENATEGVDGSKSREYYKNNPGVSVLESDILAYYVWVPRFKYEIWTTEMSSEGNEKNIGIFFETKDIAKSFGTQVGEYRTHPAFTFGDTELNGIWVGKFETSVDQENNCYKNPNNSNCNINISNPRVLPNVHPLVYQNVKNAFLTSLNFSGGVYSNNNVVFNGNNEYGLTSITNSHMMKNSEWGAVTYLSYSQYGLFDEEKKVALNVHPNNNSNVITGYGAIEREKAISIGCYNRYSIDGTKELYHAATTDENCLVKYGSAVSDGRYLSSVNGNISGIFDMAGGIREYLAAFYGQKRVNGTSLSAESGFTIDDIRKLSKINYFDSYEGAGYKTQITSTDFDITGGHAMFETNTWYGTSGLLSDNGKYIVERGCSYSCGDPGLFYFTDCAGKGNYGASGRNSSSYVFRSVLFVNSN